MAKYIRFVVAKTSSPSGHYEGLFRSAYALCRGTEILRHDYEYLDELLDWFEKHLKVPTRFNSSTSKGFYRRDGSAHSWLKSDADEHVERMRRIAAILAEYGITCEQITANRVGYVVYEDEHQVVAEPFNER